MLVSVGYTV